MRTVVRILEGATCMTEVKCEELLEGKTIKFGNIIIVGTKPAEKETEVQAS